MKTVLISNDNLIKYQITVTSCDAAKKLSVKIKFFLTDHTQKGQNIYFSYNNL